MLMRYDPFRELDRLAQLAWDGPGGTAAMPMDVHRNGDRFVVEVDVPGVDPDSIDLAVEQNVLTISAERRADLGEDAEVIAAERPQGSFRRELFLGAGLDTEHLDARYHAGVLTVTVPVDEQARPRRIQVTSGSGPKAIDSSAGA